MSKNSMTLAFCFLFHSFCFSQYKIEITYKLDPDGSYKFICINHDYLPYVINIEFQNIHNFKADASFPFKKEIGSGTTYLFEIKPINNSFGLDLKYTYTYYKGCLNPKINFDFVYLIPIKPGNESQVFKLDYFKINSHDIEPKDWYSIGFKLKSGDTVYASRRGVVSEFRDTTRLKLNEYAYSSFENYIEILHSDCSFARYEVLSKVFVELGQEVEAGDPIGLAGGDKYQLGPHIRFSVHYNCDIKNQQNNKDEKARKRYWAFVPLIFYSRESKAAQLINGSSYTSDHPEYIIFNEMSKRQIKKWQKKNSSAKN